VIDTVSPNGLKPDDGSDGPAPGLRLVFYGLSIVSDWENPAATSHRAFLRALADRGNQVVFLEERRNAPTVGLLKQRGSGPLRAFDRHYPDIPYRTYDVPPRREMDIWLGREASAADAMIAFTGTPAPVLGAFERLDAVYTLKLVERDVDSDGMMHRSGLHPPSTALPAMPYAPVVAIDRGGGEDRDIDVLIAAYDHAELGAAAAAALPGATMLIAGSAAIPDVPFVPEVELPDWYRRAAVTVVVDHGDPSDVSVRALLPLASGSASVLLLRQDAAAEGTPFITSTVEQLPGAVGRARERAGGAPGLAPFDADARAGEAEALVIEHHRG
jgi:hypothetical protein